MDHGDIAKQELLVAGLSENYNYDIKLGTDNTTQNIRTVSMYNLIDFKDGFQALAMVTAQTTNDVVKISGFRVYDYKEMLSATSFTMSGKSWLHYLFLVLCLCSVIFTIWTATRVWRANPKRRWFWMLVALTGIPQFSMDWYTGIVNMQPLRMLFFGAAVLCPEFEVPTVYFAIPTGALICMFKMKSWQKRRADINKGSEKSLLNTI